MNMPIYYADTLPKDVEVKKGYKSGQGYYKRPSLFMRKEYARLFLRVTDVKVERLQDITEEGAIKEGIESYTKDGKLFKYSVNWNWWIAYHSRHKNLFNRNFWQDMPRTALGAFMHLWNSTVDKSKIDQFGWDANPYVFVYEFERISKEEAMKEEIKDEKNE